MDERLRRDGAEQNHERSILNLMLGRAGGLRFILGSTSQIRTVCLASRVEDWTSRFFPTPKDDGTGLNFRLSQGHIGDGDRDEMDGRRAESL